MRINKYLAKFTNLSRRSADSAVKDNRVLVNDNLPKVGQTVSKHDVVTLDGKVIAPQTATLTIMLNKPVGYVCGRDGQGSKTIYGILPKELQHLNPVGRLDKDSSGLLIMTNDGDLAQRLSHPSYRKNKIYIVSLDKPLSSDDKRSIHNGIQIDNYTSKMKLTKINSVPDNNQTWQVTMSMGRNRQIRRTFEALGHTVTKLHRIQLGAYELKNLSSGHFKAVNTSNK